MLYHNKNWMKTFGVRTETAAGNRDITEEQCYGHTVANAIKRMNQDNIETKM
jgi:hypothetical protein